MANAEHLAKLNEGVGAWNEWRSENRNVHPDFIGASLADMDLAEADLRAASLSGARLVHANLIGADLTEANLVGADLRRSLLYRASLFGADLHLANLANADLRHASLVGASLLQANVSGANLAAAHLHRANLAHADLTGADLTRACLSLTIFVDNDLSQTMGLDTARHLGPSSLGIDTVYSSAGKIPSGFLRGVGVPENLITYMPSLVAPGAIQFYSCFISYSARDQEFADRLYADLQNKGVRCWFAPDDAQGGKKLHEQLDAAIRLHEKLLLILSPNSMSSKWVKTEIRNARKREVAEEKRVLFPVRLASYEALREWKLFDGDEGEDLATEIREYYIPDFSEWKNHDLYVREFEKLLRDLRTDGVGAGERTP
jgi:hypothetical protein